MEETQQVREQTGIPRMRARRDSGDWEPGQEPSTVAVELAGAAAPGAQEYSILVAFSTLSNTHNLK